LAVPITGNYAWKDLKLSPEERVDHFFNLIDHAVENGIPLAELYRREHVKEFLLYLLRRYDEPCVTCAVRPNKGSTMPKLTLTSTFASTVMVGDPGYLTFPLAPKETKTVEVTEGQLRLLTPGLEKLKGAGWLNFSVGTTSPVVEVAKVAAPPEPVAPPPPAPTPEPVVTQPVEPEVVAPASEAKEEEAPEAAPEAAPAAKPSFFEKKNRR